MCLQIMKTHCFPLCSPRNLQQILICRDRCPSLFKEAKLTCSDFRWSSMIHILALSNVLEMTTESVYLNVNHDIHPIFHRIINPLHPSGSNLGIVILWSRDGYLDNRRGFSYDLTILVCFCRSILHLKVFTLHVIQVQ